MPSLLLHVFGHDRRLRLPGCNPARVRERIFCARRRAALLKKGLDSMLETAKYSEYVGADLLTYAQKNHLRLRNLHDGMPVPPARRRHLAGFRPVYVGQHDRDMAITCRLGYVHAEGDVLGWVLLCRSGKGLGIRLGRLQKIPALAVKQEGDTEAAGTAPFEAIYAVLNVLEPYRVRPTTNPDPKLPVRAHLAPAKRREFQLQAPELGIGMPDGEKNANRATSSR